MPGRRVLVVDDDETIRTLLTEALEDEGYETADAANGRDGLAVALRWRPDVILLDLMMPIMDGWAFRAEQRRVTAVAHVPVVVISAARELAERVEPLEPAAVFSKPFDLDALLTAICRLLDGCQPRTAST